MFLQQEGGPKGLELTGAASRAFMKRWDRLYLERIRKVGIDILLYGRYLDGSYQIAVVPPTGSRYDAKREQMMIDPKLKDKDIPADERFAGVLKDLANSIMRFITMEADWPSKKYRPKDAHLGYEGVEK